MERPMKKIVIVGGRGFIGGYLAGSLSADGKFAVFAFDRGDYHRIDIIKSAGVIVWLAPPDLESMESFVKMIDLKKLEKFIFASTLLIYPSSPDAVGESAKPDPQSDYEKAKFFEERFLLQSFSGSAVKLCIARLGNVYGDAKNKGRVSEIIKTIDKKGLYTVRADGRQLRDYIFVQDAVKYLRFLINYDQTGRAEVFNVCTGIGTSISDLIREIEKAAGKKLRFRYNPAEIEKSSVGDNSKIILLSGRRPKYDLAAGLAKIYAM